jgi:hypothetical protein
MEGVSEPATAKSREVDTTPSFFLRQEMRRALIRLVATAHLSRSVLRFVWHDDIGEIVFDPATEDSCHGKGLAIKSAFQVLDAIPPLQRFFRGER